MSSNWEDCLLGDILTLQRGFDLPHRERKDGTVPVVSSSGITGFHSQVKVKAPGIVTGRYGTLGEVFYLEQDFFPLNTTLYVRDFKGNNPRFIGYLLRTLNLAHQNVAAAVPGLNRNDLHMLPVRKPPVSTQQKIVSILSAYDDLIENNTRRIKILEEMAQLLYREWFVNFRFPGHQDVPLIESELGLIPQGWELKKLGDVIELAYGKALKADDRKGGEVGVYGSSGVVGYHNQYLVKAPGIIVGRKGNVGSIFWADVDFFPIDTVYYVQTRVSLHYVYYNLQTQNFINNDAAVPGLNRNQAYSLPFLLPTQDILQKFEGFVLPVFQQLRNLSVKNENLRKTRDLLLPKLISGETDVEALNTSVIEEVQAA